ncbi:uncharacterized protein METZ01_LOCUS183754 [marine metagenome]|uniref:Uncharacterized protein n=1 Tax=marine metagenome TaxID=408172 RepID=A0A382CXK4_9ZZZZ
MRKIYKAKKSIMNIDAIRPRVIKNSVLNYLPVSYANP